MAYNTFGPGIALDRVTMRGLPVQPATITDAETGDLVTAYTLGDDPQSIVLATNAYGYFPQFQVLDVHRRLVLAFGNVSLELIAFELVTEALDAANAAALEAAAAAAAAAEAATLVGAPADTAIKTILDSVASLTRIKLDALYGAGFNSVAVKLFADLPDAYPIGTSVFNLTSDASGFPINWAQVRTVRNTAGRAEQWISSTSTTSAGRVFYRVSNGPNSWGAAKEIITDVATTTTAGLMSAADKTRLDSTPTSTLATSSANGLMPATDKAKLDNAVSTATASRLMIRDAAGRAAVATPSATGDIATKGYVDGRTPTATAAVAGLMPATDKAKLDAATASDVPSTLVLRNAAGNFSVAEPASATHAASKGYADGLVAVKILPTTAHDLNDYVTTNTYHQNSNAGATAGANYPMPYAGKVEVVAASSMVYQEYTAYGSIGVKLYRTKYGAIWYPWRIAADTADVANARETTARVIHYEHATYGSYEVITVNTNGKFIPGLVHHEYADGYETAGTTGVDFKPIRTNLDYEFARTGYDIIASASGYATSGNLNEVPGAQIRNGVIYHDFGLATNQKGTDAIGFRADGTSKMYSIRWGDSAASMVADGVVDCFGFGPTLVKDGVQVNLEADPQWDWFKTEDSARQILGQTSTGSIIIITVFGVSGVSGIKGNELAAISALHGCRNAVMLDGGGSAQTLTNGIYSHTSSDASRQRPMPDYIGIRARIMNELDTGWVNCTLGANGTLNGGVLPAARRRGDEVSMRWGVSGTGLAANTFYEVAFLPAGMHGATADRYYSAISNTPANAGTFTMDANGRIVLRTGATVGTYYMFDNVKFRIL